MKANAKNPEYVFDKVRECRFFLSQVAAYEKATDDKVFRDFLSAFMSAFRTIAYRLYGVTKHRLGRTAKDTLKSQVESHPDIGFLLEKTNIEVHEDGVLILHPYLVHDSASIPDRWKSAWWPDTNRWQTPFDRLDRDIVGIRPAEGWQFAGNRRDLIEVCHDALNALEEYARQAIVTARDG